MQLPAGLSLRQASAAGQVSRGAGGRRAAFCLRYILISCRPIQGVPLHFAPTRWGWEGDVRIDRACEEFLRDCANVRKLSEHTTRAYRLDLARFTRFVGSQTDIASFDRTVLVQYV